MPATETRDAVMGKIETLLKAANGRRRERTMKADDAFTLLMSVVDGLPVAWDHSGTVANAYTHAAVTTLVLAARVGGKVYLGVDVASATGSPTPGRAWAALQPWRDARGDKPEGPAGDSAAKWATWSGLPGVIEIHGPELDALMEVAAGVA